MAACGGGGKAPGSSADGAPLASGQTAFARKLGGAGFEAASGIATCADGSLIAASAIGSVTQHATVGVSRISAAGATVWAKTFEVNGEGGLVGVACSPLGNVFLGVRMISGSADFGGGGFVGDTIVKLSPAGAFTWQHSFATFLLWSFAVDGNGSVLAGLVDRNGTSPWLVTKLRWDGQVLWTIESPVAGQDAPMVAWDPAGNAIVGAGGWIRKYGPDGSFGRPVWSVELSADGDGVSITGVGTTAIGTVVATGAYGDWNGVNGGTMAAGDKTLAWQPVQSSVPAFAMAVEGVDGYVRWLRNRPSGGPMAVDPEGRIAFIDTDGPMFTDANCRSDLARWDLTGKELWRRPLVTCVRGNFEPGWGARGHGVAIAPDHQIWAQGDAIQPFDAGTGTVFTPRGNDWFILRVAP